MVQGSDLKCKASIGENIFKGLVFVTFSCCGKTP